MRKVSCGPPQAADLTPAMAWGSRCHLGGLGLFSLGIAAKTLPLLGSWWGASSGVSNSTEGSEPPKPGLRRPLPLDHKPDPQSCPSEHGLTEPVKAMKPCGPRGLDGVKAEGGVQPEPTGRGADVPQASRCPSWPQALGSPPGSWLQGEAGCGRKVTLGSFPLRPASPPGVLRILLLRRF